VTRGIFGAVGLLGLAFITGGLVEQGDFGFAALTAVVFSAAVARTLQQEPR
jgi:hypothetical protein